MIKMFQKCINILSICLIYQLTSVACQNPSIIDPQGDTYSSDYSNQVLAVSPPQSMPQQLQQQYIPYYPTVYQLPVYPNDYYQNYYQPTNNAKLNTRVTNWDDYEDDSSRRHVLGNKKQQQQYVKYEDDNVGTFHRGGLLQRLLSRGLDNNEEEKEKDNIDESGKAYVLKIISILIF